MMFRRRFYSKHDGWFDAWSCPFCGEVIDETIRMNRGVSVRGGVKGERVERREGVEGEGQGEVGSGRGKPQR